MLWVIFSLFKRHCLERKEVLSWHALRQEFWRTETLASFLRRERQWKTSERLLFWLSPLRMATQSISVCTQLTENVALELNKIEFSNYKTPPKWELVYNGLVATFPIFINKQSNVITVQLLSYFWFHIHHSTKFLRKCRN